MTAQTPQTPMMQQYFSQKELYKDCLLFFRMGDFFELFHDDAITASKALDIALTKRGKTEGTDIPMCGVPVHSYEPYLQRLIKAGFKVAICDQIELPSEAKKRGYKEIVRREVVRVITPGTLLEESLLDATKANYLLSFARDGDDFGLAWVDISTGEFACTLVTAAQLPSELERLKPSEILLSDALLYEETMFETYNDWKEKLTPLSANIFAHKRAENRLKEFFKVISLEGFAALHTAEISACGALLDYLELTQKQTLPALQFPTKLRAEHYMSIDPATRRSLEITEALNGGKSFFDTINRCQTSSGARLLRQLLSSPLIYAEGINARLACTEYFYENVNIATQLKTILGEMPDLERITTRITMNRASARDMLVLRTALAKGYEVKQLLDISRHCEPQARQSQDEDAMLRLPRFARNDEIPTLLKTVINDIKNFPELLSKLVEAFEDEVPVDLKDGNFIRPGYSKTLDEQIMLRDNSRKLIQDLRTKYITETSIPNLKISHNNLIGYYIEVSQLQASKMPPKFIQRQGLATATRYTSPELIELQNKIYNAQNAALTAELSIFEETVTDVKNQTTALMQTAKAIAFIDFFLSLGLLAAEKKYTKPTVDDSNNFTIKNGRHPVVEENTEFVANSCNLNPTENLWLLTGPNMAGKSTFLRQNALITILAQIGSYVPASAVHIGSVDKVFSRVGASDNLSRGHSTFMVEMVETAAILNQATAKSLIILDEIGRGTATYDGLSIAWAVLEHIHNHLKSRTIFATHYHELTELKLARLKLHSMKVKEWKDSIIFLHEVIPGSADKSYGIHVAKLAGLPKNVVERAEKILIDLEHSPHGEPIITKSKPKPTSNILENIDPNNLSPREALELLFRLKQDSK